MKIKGRYFQAKSGADTILVSGNYEYVLHQDDSWEKIPAVHTPDSNWLYGRFDIGKYGWELEDCSWEDDIDIVPAVTLEQLKKMRTYDVLKGCAERLDFIVSEIEIKKEEEASVDEYLLRERMELQNQLATLKTVLYDLLGRHYLFSRTDTYYGVCTEDEEEWLFKVERESI